MRNLAIIVMSLVPALALAQTATKTATPATPAAPAAGAAAAKAPVPPPQPPPATPTAPPEVKLTVDRFKGNWKFETTMSATGMPGMDKPVTAKMSFNCKEVAG